MGSKEIIAKALAEKLPPQNIEAEMSVLGSMLLDEDATAKAIEILKEDYFYKESHRIVYRALCSLYSQSRAADLITLSDILRKENKLEAVGGAAYLAELTQAVPTAANIEHYALIIKEMGILRNLINAATQIVSEGYSPGQNADELLDKAEAMIFDITSHKAGSGFVSLKDIIKDSIEAIDSLYQRKEVITGVPSGFTELDERTAGLQNSDLIVIAGRPSMGKSALALSIAEYAAVHKNIPTAMFSLEMSKEQLVQRMLTSYARVDAHKVRTGFLSQSDWPKLTQAASKLSEAPIYIDDTPSITALELKAKARRLKSQYDIKLIILDYLQLMQGTSSENRQQQISDISRGLKALARELSVPLIAISQLSRAVESRQDHRPLLSDLRESGAIEQDADVVLLLLREEYYSPTEENKGITELIIAKQRNGPVGSMRLAFVKEFTRFENLSKREVL